MEAMSGLFRSFLVDGGYVILGLVVLALAKIIKDVITPFDDDHELTIKDNPALGVSVAGYYIAVFAIYIGAFVGPASGSSLNDTLKDLAIVFAYSIGGILLLNVSRVVVDRFMLNKFSVTKEILEDRNAGSGAVECGNYIASGLIIAGAVNGEGGGALTALVFFVLGELVLVLYGLFYQVIARYDVHSQIEQDNVSAGVSMGGNLVAVGIILLKSLKGDFLNWTENLSEFAFSAVIGFVTLFLIRLALDWVLLPKTTLTHEIANDRNLSAALIETAVLIGVASVIFFAL